MKTFFFQEDKLGEIENDYGDYAYNDYEIIVGLNIQQKYS